MREINLTEGNDAKLNALMKRRGELFPVELSEEVHAEVVSRIGGRTSCGCEVTDVGTVLVDVPGSLLPGGYIVAVYGVLDGAKWRSACRGLLVTRVTEGTSLTEKAESIVSDGDAYDITMEVQMYKADVPGAIAAHNQDKTAHADIRELIPTLPKHIVTDADYVHTDNNYTMEEKEKLRGLANYDDAEVRSLIAQKQDVISDLDTIRGGAEKGVSAYQMAATIEDLIPSQTSEENQLADKGFVNSSISTATAAFKGTHNSVEELEQVPADANDYGFVISTDSAGNTVYNRYKYSNGRWQFEYALNNSSFTAAQWAAINSAITSGDVEKLAALPTKAQLDALLATKVDKVEGKGLSSNDFTTEEKNKLAGLSNYDDTALRTLIGTKAEKVNVEHVVLEDIGQIIQPNTIYELTYNAGIEIDLDSPITTEKCEYCIKFDVATTIPTLTLPDDIVWSETLALEANTHYVLLINFENGALYGDWKSYPLT